MRTIVRTLSILGFLLASVSAQAQCGKLNWDYLAFLNPVLFGSTVVTTPQYFALGTNLVTVTHNYGTSSANIVGDNNGHTADAGYDVQIKGNGTVTFTFQSPVTGVSFSLYDVDLNQTAQINAFNGATPLNVTMTSGGNHTITNSGTPTAKAVATSAASPVTSNNATVRVSISGTVTSFQIVITNTTVVSNGNPNGQDDGSYWISSIQACYTSNFPLAYRLPAKPYTNQGSYVLTAMNNKVYQLNPANGIARLLFADPSNNNINSMGYDPINKILYYTYSLTASPATDKTIKKYDFNSETIGTFVTDITTLGIPLFSSGVESGGASFYDGALYIGIEGNAGGQSVMWRIDRDGSLNPVSPARQVFSIQTDTHDWGDFVISNGVLYDFNGKSTGADVLHYDLATSAVLQRYTGSTLTFAPHQVAADWQEKIFDVGSTGSGVGTIAYYGGAGAVSNSFTITTPPTTPSASFGDAGEAFKPKVDFGDAPASYDPVGSDPAVTEIDPLLMLGTNVDQEWSTRGQGVLANSDNYDDGLIGTSVLNPNAGTYLIQVSVFNNTGSNATLIGWLDFNGDGVFSANEGVSMTISSSNQQQTVNMYWTGISSSLMNGSYTYLRLRLTSASNGMTTANPTGYFYNGEVEDYRVAVSSTPLKTTLVRFEARPKAARQVELSWSVLDQESGTQYWIERSADQRSWTTLHREAGNTEGNASFGFRDEQALPGTSYYRLRYLSPGGTVSFSAIQKIQFAGELLYTVPNPLSAGANITIYSTQTEVVELSLTNLAGQRIWQQRVSLQEGSNPVPVATVGCRGVLLLQIRTARETYTHRLLLN